METDKVYFKVLNNGERNLPPLSSACQNIDMPDSIRVIYKVGEFVKPNLVGSKLFVFCDEDAAIKFAGSLDNVSVWSCHILYPTPTPAHIGRVYMIEEFWKGNEEAKAYYHSVPFGTLWCDEVKILEEVWNDKNS